MVAIWDDQQSMLVPQAAAGFADNDGVLEVLYEPGEGLPGQVFDQGQAIRLDEVAFAQHYNLSPDNLFRYRNATRGHLPVSSIAVPIMAGALTTEDDKHSPQTDEVRATPLGVLVLDNVQMTAAFTGDDLALITSLAQQTALTLENARLYQSSEQRSLQLQALTEVSTTITTNLQPEELISTLLDQLNEILPYDTGTLWLLEKQTAQTRSARKDRMIVRAARGFDDSDERLGLAVDIQDSLLLNEMANTGQPISVADVRADPRFTSFSYEVEEGEDTTPSNRMGFENLSWMGIPLITAGEVIGVIALEKYEANFYRDDDIQVATAFAGQAATGLENALLYQESVQRAQELDQRSQDLTILNRLSSDLSRSLDKTQILGTAIREFAQVLPSSSVTALSFESKNKAGDSTTENNEVQVILQAEHPVNNKQQSFSLGDALPHVPVFTRLSETLGIFNSEDVSQEPDLAPLKEFLDHHKTRSLLIIPIFSGQAQGDEIDLEHHLHGVLMAHNDQPHRFDPDELELARTISYQTAIALQNASLYDETRSLTDDLEIRVQERTSELKREHQRAETLLRIITELSASLDLDQILHSTLEVLSEFVNADQITILVARPGERKLHRLASVGVTPPPSDDGTPTPFDIGQGLAGWIISNRQSVLIDDVLKDERWVELSYSEREGEVSHEHRSAIGVPLMSGADALGALLLFHSATRHFSLDQLDLVQAAANQVASAVNNAELYRLIRDQAEDLGNMLRSQQIETSRSKAILEAVADGVVVTDEERQITLFNESAEQILSLNRSQVIGKSLENFSGLFGRAAQSWMETIRTWSRDPSTYQSADTHAEQITLEDGRVISVHLAPVSLRNDFLGTVSIFQDITHQVEVDRLKSEFVATVSHELRTPMTSIKGYVEVLLMGAAGELSEQQTSFLDIVKTNTERLAVLVNDLLDISQMEAGRASISLQSMNLEKVADQAIEDLQRRSSEDEKPVEIIKQISPDLPRVKGDPERIRQIFDNLLDNAYQYTPEGEISIIMKSGDGEVQVDITDNGVGIHPADHERVFERFFRGENPLVLGVSGTGLGLSIVKNLVSMHNGRIWFESMGVAGKGSTFSFTIPVYRQAEN